MPQHNPNNVVNRVDYFGQILIDLSSDTVTPDKLCKGAIAHAANGSVITGTAEVSIEEDLVTGETGIVIPELFLAIGSVPEEITE